MEKLVYVVWRKSGVDPGPFGAHMRGELAPRLGEAGARRIALNLVDDDVQSKLSARVGSWDPPVDGMVSFWLESAKARGEAESALADATSQLAGYRVEESVPIVNSERRAAPGRRTPGINMVTCIERPERMSHEAWIERWHGHHERVAIETQCTYAYVRNVVVEPLTAGAPPWSGIVEEGFPTEAVGDPMVWYCADGDPEVMKRNLARMVESCRAFLDLDRVVSTPMSEYRLGDDAPA
ncbi:MAG: EthD domain-containing protein [Myxococcota bacterium]